jgi:hypothetical protein
MDPKTLIAASIQGRQRLTGAIILGVLLLVIMWALFVPGADWLAHHDVGSAAGSLHETAVDNARSRLLTLAAGLLAAGALGFTALNFLLSRQGQVTDRYTKAIEQLGSDKLDIRIGGIYALERIARDSKNDHPTVMEVLTAFIREHSHERWPLPDAEGRERRRRVRPDMSGVVTSAYSREPLPSPGPERREDQGWTRPDVQAAVTVVGRRKRERDVSGTRLDLVGANLIGADLTEARLAGASLFGADLSGADLWAAELGGAVLTGANFAGAFLINARLAGADLIGALLVDAYLDNAYLRGASLSGANLTGASLGGAVLKGANLTGANLTGEVLGLKWSDIDLDESTVTIGRSRVLVDYKQIVKEPKSARSWRTLPLLPPLAQALGALRDLQAIEAIDAGSAYQASGYVAADELGIPVHPERYSDEFDRICKAAGLPKIRLHDTRGTMNTILEQAGVSDSLRAAWLGHSVAVNRSSYLARPEDLTQVGNAIGGLL